MPVSPERGWPPERSGGPCPGSSCQAGFDFQLLGAQGLGKAEVVSPDVDPMLYRV